SPKRTGASTVVPSPRMTRGILHGASRVCQRNPRAIRVARNCTDPPATMRCSAVAGTSRLRVPKPIMDTIALARSRPRSTLDGIVTLCGYLGVLCALAAAVATVVDWRAERDQETWPRATAVVRRCDVQETHSHLRNAGGREWTLWCTAELGAE